MAHADLPSGLVTFLFTDIVGSTSLVQLLSDRYPPMLIEHRRLLRRVLATAEGIELSAEGDGCMFVFPSTTAALDGCVRAQRELTGPNWPEGLTRPAVRMGLSAGLAEPVDGEYISAEAHRAARIATAAHGGQILCSEAATSHITTTEGPPVVDLGLYLLRGFDLPERLFQVCASGLRQSFPTLRATKILSGAEGSTATPGSPQCRGVARDGGRRRASTDLTRAESAVALLVAEGMSNPQIASRLSISRYTVETHLKHIFTKLEVASRAGLAAAVTRSLAATLDDEPAAGQESGEPSTDRGAALQPPHRQLLVADQLLALADHQPRQLAVSVLCETTTHRTKMTAAGSPAVVSSASEPDRLHGRSWGSRPAITNVPARNPHFTGRDAALANLNHQMHAPHRTATVPTSAIYGLGGIGKTQLALEYAYRYRADYDLIWWINAELPTTVIAALAALGSRLGLPVADQFDAAVILERLHGRERWLLVYDNAEQPNQLDGLLPADGGGHILITSRWPAWAEHGTPLGLGVLSRAESIAFLQQRTGLDQTVTAHFDQLAELLGDLPLALNEAAAYLEQTRESPTAYLNLVRTRSHDLFRGDDPGHRTDDQRDRRRVATIWTLALERIHADTPAAESLLNLLAYLAPDTPRSLPTEYSDILPQDLAAMVTDHITYNGLLAILGRYSLVTLTPTAIGTHRLVQTVLRARLHPAVANANAHAALDLIYAAFPEKPWEIGNWSAVEQLLPHLIAVTGHAERHDIISAKTGRLLDRAARYLLRRGRYRAAEPLARRSIITTEAALGTDHRETAWSYDCHGQVLRALGDYAAARSQHEHVLRIGAATVDPDDPDMAHWRNNFGVVLHAVGDLSAARAEYEHAIRIGEATAGPDHPDAATRRTNLGSVLHDLGDLAAAREQFEHAIHIGMATVGPEHPSMAGWRDNLGCVLRDLGDLSAARAELEHAIRICNSTLGPDHPDMAHWRKDLGNVLAALGDLTAARIELEHAIRIGEAALPPDHPDLNRWRRNLKDLATRPTAQASRTYRSRRAKPAPSDKRKA